MISKRVRLIAFGIFLTSISFAQNASKESLTIEQKTEELRALGVEADSARDLGRRAFLESGPLNGVEWAVQAGRLSRRGFSVQHEVASELSMLSRWAREQGKIDDARIVAVEVLKAVAEVEKLPSRWERTRAALLEAEVYEEVFFDMAKARSAFEKALKLDPSDDDARRGKARMDLRDSVTAQRIAEQQQLLREVRK